jgi:hypothetical protein
MGELAEQRQKSGTGKAMSHDGSRKAARTPLLTVNNKVWPLYDN